MLTGMDRKCVNGCFVLAESMSRLIRVLADKTPPRSVPETTETHKRGSDGTELIFITDPWFDQTTTSRSNQNIPNKG